MSPPNAEIKHRSGTATGTPHIVRRLDAWPKADQRAWEAGVSDIGKPGLRRRRHADFLSPKSIDLAWKSYGRFLHILAEHADLDPLIGPAERVTFETVALFFDRLRAAGNIDNTIKARLFHLRTALHIMAPGHNFDWITRPDGCSLDALLPAVPNHDKFTPSSVVLFAWGKRLMDIKASADLPPNPVTRMAAYRRCRDGLIIAILACRAPRLGSLSQMRVSKNLYRLNGAYWVHLQSQIVKNKTTLEYSLPDELTPYIDRYLTEIRPALLYTAKTDAVWGNGDGNAFTYRSIQTMINRRTQVEFGPAFGPHRFRDSFASTLAAADTNNPGLAAVILGITEHVVAAHYRQGRQADAAMKLQANLRAERMRTRQVAQRYFDVERCDLGFDG